MASAAEWAKILRVADKVLALLLLDKGPRSMDISVVYTCQSESECGTEAEQCEADNPCKCNRVVEAKKSAKIFIVKDVR